MSELKKAKTKHSMMHEDTQIAVIGAGPAGLATAILLARSGVNTYLFDRPPPKGFQDLRTSALMQGSVQLLRHIGVWPQLAAHTAPLWVMRLIDVTGRKLKAQDIDFDSHELGNQPFGWNIPNNILVDALKNEARDTANLHIYETQGLDRIELERTHVRLIFEEAELTTTAKLVIGADGRHSRVRSESRIQVNKWRYNQTAVVCTFAHEEPHNGVSTEFHCSAGPLTLVPLDHNRSSLVWMEKPKRAERLAALGNSDFAETLERATKSALGGVRDVGPRQKFPISGLTARKFASNRAMLVGEAGHVFPPIGAQGLNLGLRDGALAAELVEDALNERLDPGNDLVLNEYDRRRRRDIMPRTVAIDLLNRSLTSDLLPFQGLRKLGIMALDKFGPLRRALMNRGIAPVHDLPRVMRPPEPQEQARAVGYR